MIYITLYEETDLFVNKQRLLGIPELRHLFILYYYIVSIAIHQKHPTTEK